MSQTEIRWTSKKKYFPDIVPLKTARVDVCLAAI
jgi:hypothetical protein